MKDPKYFRQYNYDRGLLPNEHLRTLETDVSTLDEARLRTGATIGYPGWGVLYYVALGALRRDRPNIVIETGTNYSRRVIVSVMYTISLIESPSTPS